MQTEHPIVLWRKATGHRQAELARQLGILPSSLSAVEKGLRRPGAGLCIQIERLCGIPIAVLRPDLYPDPASSAPDAVGPGGTHGPASDPAAAPPPAAAGSTLSPCQEGAP